MEVTIEKLIYGGDGLAHLPADEHGRGKAVFVPFVLPGERAEVSLTENKPGFARAKLNRVVEPAPARNEPGCPYFGECGGCQYQHASYDDQLRFKSEILRETLRRTAKIEFDDEIRAHPSKPWNYRNRTRMRVRREPEFAIGYNRFASHSLLPVRECPISSPLINRALAAMWKLGESRQVPGCVTEVEFFANSEDSELLLELTVASQELQDTATFAHALKLEVPSIVGVVPFHSRGSETRATLPGANASVVRVDVPREFASSFGEMALTYRTANTSYRVSAGSFFQTNRFLVDEMAGLATEGRSGGFALDLYAGVGLFSLPLSHNFRQVAAVESAPFSFDDLKSNSPPNVKGYGVAVDNFLASVPRETRFDYIVADPPRAGLGERVAKIVAGLKAPKFTYVSCDPATLARDLGVLTAAGYRIREMHLVDMFPQTFHIETVTLLER